MEETIDLKEYFYIIKKRAWIIALITVTAMIASGIISFFLLSPVYETKTTLIVNTEQVNETNTITGDQLNVTQKLTLTYGEIIKSRTVIDEVIQALNLNMEYGEVSKMITVSPVKDTQIIAITVQDTNPQRAADIANTIPRVFTKEVKRITKANSVEVIDKAVVAENPIKPNKIMNIAIAGVLGVMIGLFIIFVLEYMDNKIKTPQDIEKYIELPILGVIPNENISKKGGR